MEPKVVELGPLIVMGLMERFTAEQEHIGELWGKVAPYLDRIAVYSTDRRCYGIARPTGTAGEWDYLAGMAVSKVVADGLNDLVVLEIPATRFVSLKTTLDNMDAGFAYIDQQWLPGSPYVRDPRGPTLDVYPPGTDSGDSPVILYVPIVERPRG